MVGIIYLAVEAADTKTVCQYIVYCRKVLGCHPFPGCVEEELVGDQYDVSTNLRLPHCMFIMNKRVNEIIISQSV